MVVKVPGMAADSLPHSRICRYQIRIKKDRRFPMIQMAECALMALIWLFGASIFSFLNVVIYRVPRQMSFVRDTPTARTAITGCRGLIWSRYLAGCSCGDDAVTVEERCPPVIHGLN